MIAGLLQRAAEANGFSRCLLGTDEGLLLGYAGDVATHEELAGFASLFDSVVDRAEQHVGLNRVDEVAFLDPGHGRLVLRPIVHDGRRYFLVVQLPTNRYWRKATNALCREITTWLQDYAAN